MGGRRFDGCSFAALHHTDGETEVQRGAFLRPQSKLEPNCFYFPSSGDFLWADSQEQDRWVKGYVYF